MSRLDPKLLRRFPLDPVVEALLRRRQIELDKSRGITETGRHVVPMAQRCVRCQGRRVVVTTWDGLTTRIVPCPNCSKTPPPAPAGWSCMQVAA